MPDFFVVLLVALWALLAFEVPISRAEPGFTVHQGGEYRTFGLRGTHGTYISVAIYADGSAGVLIFQPRRSAINEYRTLGLSSEGRVRGRFRGLGYLDMRWKPFERPRQTREPQGDCKGPKALVQKGMFIGSFFFRGESGYTKASAKRIGGTSIRSFREVCRGPDAGPEPTIRPEEILSANLKEPQREVHFRASTRAAPGGRIDEFEAALIERSPNLTVERAVFGGGGTFAGQFTFDHSAGTVTVMPPTPFRGSAVLNPISAIAWNGDLAVSFLGGDEEVPLAGPEFKASLRQQGGGLSSD